MPLTNGKLSVYNLKRRPFRTTCLIIIAAVLAFTLFGGSILTISLKNGMNSMKQRLGADLMVVPDGYEADMEGILLKGEPGCFYFDDSIVQQIAQIKGVSEVTPQFFLTSLSSSCCSAQVQLIGFDPDTDFVIKPWITKTYESVIEDGYFIAGSDIVLESDHTLKFFNHSYPVAAQLEKTATGLDSSVFMSINTMKKLFAAAREGGMNFIFGEDPEGAVSSVPIRIDKGYDLETVANNIRSGIPNVEVIVSQKMIAGLSENMETLIVYIRVLSAVIWIFASIIMMVAFTVTINERKKEFAIFRILGSTRRKLGAIILTESLFVSATGSISGAAAASAVVFPFSNYIGARLKLPYLEPEAGTVFGVLLLCMIFSVVVGPLASVYSAVKISRAETYLSMREGE